jgi:hypothetical protein
MLTFIINLNFLIAQSCKEYPVMENKGFTLLLDGNINTIGINQTKDSPATGLFGGRYGNEKWSIELSFYIGNSIDIMNKGYSDAVINPSYNEGGLSSFHFEYFQKFINTNAYKKHLIFNQVQIDKLKSDSIKKIIDENELADLNWFESKIGSIGSKFYGGVSNTQWSLKDTNYSASVANLSLIMTIFRQFFINENIKFNIIFGFGFTSRLIWNEIYDEKKLKEAVGNSKSFYIGNEILIRTEISNFYGEMTIPILWGEKVSSITSANPNFRLGIFAELKFLNPEKVEIQDIGQYYMPLK